MTYDFLHAMVVVGEVDAEGTLFPNESDLAQFITRYAQYSTEYVVSRRKLHLLYGRGITLAIANQFNAIARVMAVAESARGNGIAVEASVSALECLSADNCQVKQLVRTVDSLYLKIEPALEASNPTGLAALLDQLIADKTALHISGSPATLRSLGTLRSEEFNGRYITVLADQLQTGKQIKVAGVESSPCRTHLRMYIDRNGDIFPCGGMLGVSRAKLGSIYIEDISSLYAERPDFDFTRLAHFGPDIDLPSIPIPFDVCEAHRNAIRHEREPA